MNFFKKSIFVFSLIAVQLSVKIEAQIAGCGGTFTNLSGTISSPRYPSNYTDYLNCYYYIQISPANSVNITFISFDTEPCCDYLQVSCLTDSSKAVPKFYGTNAPSFLSINPCSSVRLVFYTDSSVVRQGFSLRYDIGNGLQGGLTKKPMNAYVRNNLTQPIVLSCSSRANLPGVYPWWSFSADGTFFSIITAQNCSVFSSIPFSSPAYFNTSRQYSTGTCNLTVSPSFVTSAVGFYTCTDATLDIASALAVYLNTSFTGSLLSSATTEVVQNDKFTFGCSARVQTISSYLQIIPSLYIYSVEDQRLIFSSNTTASSIVSASPESLPSYACDINYTRAGYFPTGYATNMPDTNSLVTPSRQVLYWPENTRMSIQGDDKGTVVANGSLSCFVPANPPAIYQWTNQETRLLWRGPTVAVSNNGTYTCIATNIIRGIPYEASKSIDITVIDGQQTLPYTEKTEPEDKLNSVALIVGVVLGAAVLLLLILTIVAFVCLCRKRSSVRTDSSHENNNPVILRDKNLQKSQNHQNDHLYELTQRETLHPDQRTFGTSRAKHDSNFYDNLTEEVYDSEIYTEGGSQP